jgi:acetyl esterase/lipase
MYVPMEVTGELYLRLKEAGVRVANIVLPQSVHGFDLVLPSISPPAQAALYYVEHFLASLV